MYYDLPRRPRDMPPLSSNRYRDTGLYDYAQPARSSRPTRYVSDPIASDPAQPSSPPRDRHRRRSVSGAHDPSYHPHHRRAHVVASDDGRTARDPYTYPERTSRHDVEAKTSDRNRQFREQRRGYETAEAENLRRAKSHSPRRAAREEMPRRASPQTPSKPTGVDDAYDPYRSSAKPAARGQQYYGEDVYGSRGPSGKDYYASLPPAAMPRPPAGDYHSLYKSSPLSPGHGPGLDDAKLPSKHASREAPPPRASRAAYPDPYEYDSAPPPRRSRSTRAPDVKPPPPAPSGGAYDDYGYAAAPPPAPRGRERAAPPRGYDYDDEPPYDRAPRARQRQSMPPRSRYPPADDYGDDVPDDGYAAPPRRRATSVNHHYDRDAGYEDDERRGRRGGPEERGGGARPRATTTSGDGGAAASAKSKRNKEWGKKAGNLFVTHALPVIKKEAVPFLTKTAQAYMKQHAR